MYPVRPETTLPDYAKQPDVRTTVTMTDAHTRRVGPRWDTRGQPLDDLADLRQLIFPGAQLAQVHP